MARILARYQKVSGSTRIFLYVGKCVDQDPEYSNLGVGSRLWSATTCASQTMAPSLITTLSDSKTDFLPDD